MKDVGEGHGPPAERRRVIAGHLVTALVVLGVLAVGTSIGYLRLRNRTERELMLAPATSFARALARDAAGARSPADAQKAVKSVQSRAGHIDGAGDLQQAAVVAEPRSTKYRFLRKRRYLAHLASERVGQALDRRSAGDKALYDLASRVREGGAVTDVSETASRDIAVTVAVPVQQHGKHHATAIVTFRPPTVSSLPAAGPVAAWLLGGVLLVGLFGGCSRARRYGALAMACVVSVIAAAIWLRGVAAAGQQMVAALSARLDAATGLKPLVVALEPPWWALAVGLAIAAAILAAGWLGIGARLAAMLSRHRLAYGLLLPAGVGMLVLVFVPFGYGLALGFFNHAHGTYTFVGLSNFAEILNNDRPLSHALNFYFTLGVTVLWTSVNVLLHLVIGLALALLLADRGLRLSGVYRALLILPWAIPNYITALIWKGMFHQQFGAVNQILELIGVAKISWFSSFSTAFCANVVTNTWLGFPFMMVVSLGALQSIPRDVYEAAAVDGASRTQAFFAITLPLLRPALVPAVILGSIWTFNSFNIIYLVSNGAPAGATDILVTEGYRWAFEHNRYGLAAAYATLIFIVLLAYTMLTRRVTRSAEEAHG